jgi:hypothetical protein
VARAPEPLGPIVAGVRAGKSVDRAREQVSDRIVALSLLKAELGLLRVPPRFRRAQGLFERWLEAELLDALAVQSWVAALRANDPDEADYAAQHIRRERRARAAKAAFLHVYPLR